MRSSRIEVGTVEDECLSAQWTLQKVGDDAYRIASKWNSDHQINFESGRIAVGAVEDGCLSALWKLDGMGFHKLVKRAKEQNSSFEILGHPRRVEDDDDDDDGAEAALEKDKKSEEAPAQAVPEPAGAALEPEAKRLRAEKDSLTQACDVASKARKK